MSISLTYANQKNLAWLLRYDEHVRPKVIEKKIEDKQIIIVQKNNDCMGWLRFGFLWDKIPFMNLLFVLEKYQRQGIGKKLVSFWETEMKTQNHSLAMTSSQADEAGQYFYRKLGYKDVGSLLIPEQTSTEIFFIKSLQ